MKEFIEKLIGRLEEEKSKGYYDSNSVIGEKNCWNKAIEIVNELAEKFATDINVVSNNGWIPCSERLPDTDHISGVSETVLVTTNNNSIFTAEYHGNGKWLDDVADWSLEVIAWQPLPQPYKEKSTSSAEWKQHLLNRFEGGSV